MAKPKQKKPAVKKAVKPAAVEAEVKPVVETTPVVEETKVETKENKESTRPAAEELRKQEAVRDAVRGEKPFFTKEFDVPQADGSVKQLEISFFPYEEYRRVYAFWFDKNESGKWTVQGRNEAVEPADRTTNPVGPQQNFINQRRKTMSRLLEIIREEALIGKKDEFGSNEEFDELSDFNG